MEQPIFGPGSELKSIVVVLFIGENDQAKLVILNGGEGGGMVRSGGNSKTVDTVLTGIFTGHIPVLYL